MPNFDGTIWHSPAQAAVEDDKVRGGDDAVGGPRAEEGEPEPVVGGEPGPELRQRRHHEDARHGDEVKVPPAGQAEEAEFQEVLYNCYPLSRYNYYYNFIIVTPNVVGIVAYVESTI